ncbi:MAG: peptidase inhibitor family I36 protein [Pseudolabrys sp.]
MRLIRIAAAVVVALVSVAAMPAAPAFAQGRGGPVCVFEHVGFNGRQLCFSPGQNIPSISSFGGFWNDRISSITVAPGFVVRACQHDGFRGRCVTYDRSVPNLVADGFNDTISSLQVTSRGGGPGFGGGPGGPGGPGFGRDDLREEMFALRRACDAGDRRACIRFGIIIGENRERRSQWRRDNPDLFWWER